MDRFQIKKLDDNSLFRYLSKSYSKKKSIDFLPSSQTTKNSPHDSYKKSLIIRDKNRSNSSCIYNQLSKSQTISEKYFDSRPGFLKYKRFSTSQNTRINSSISTIKSSYKRWGSQHKQVNQKDFICFEKLGRVKQTKGDFGLRTVVCSIKNQFRQQNKQQNEQKNRKDETSEWILSDKSRKMFLGQKQYNLNGFVNTQNMRSFNKAKKSIISQTIKTSLLRKGIKRNHQKTTGPNQI